jgi:4,5-dihydroxyphthalate decarboxylase
MALALGDVLAEDIELNVHRLPTPEVLARGDRYEFEVSEYSVSKYIEERDSGNNRYQAIPVFLSRFFRHWSMYVRKDSGITKPEYLRGKRAGVLNYRYTSSVWTRGILQHEFGIVASDLNWIQVEDVRPPNDPHVRLETRLGADLNKMLVEGDVDFIVAPYPPPVMLEPNSPVRRLLPNAGELERDYYRQTGIFPQMHTLVIQTAVLEEHPWVAGSLYTAFHEAKKWAYLHLKGLRVSLPWLYEQIEEVDVLMGRDHWPYGFEANRSGIDLVVSYMVEQKIIDNQMAAESLFLNLN